MPRIIALALVCCIFFTSVCDATVHDLTSETFFKETATGAWFIKFFAPWCGHCKNLEPTWERLSNEYPNIGRVDCTKDKGLCKAFGINGYPTLKLLVDGRQYNFRGKRTLPDLEEFIEGGYVSHDSLPLPQSDQVPPDSDFEEAIQIIRTWGQNHFFLTVGVICTIFLIGGCSCGIMIQLCAQAPARRPVPRREISQQEGDSVAKPATGDNSVASMKLKEN